MPAEINKLGEEVGGGRARHREGGAEQVQRPGSESSAGVRLRVKAGPGHTWPCGELGHGPRGMGDQPRLSSEDLVQEAPQRASSCGYWPGPRCSSVTWEPVGSRLSGPAPLRRGPGVSL